MSDFNTILSAVKSAAEQQLTKIFVPSVNEEFIFRPLTAKQQKDLVKTAAEKSANLLVFLECINGIINTNSMRPYDFSLFDRNYIIVMLRANTMSADYITNGIAYDLTKLSGNKTTLPDDLKTHTVSSPELIITCCVPTLKTDSKYNNFILGTLKRSDADILGDMFIYEVAKYVSKIQLPNQNIDVLLSDLPVLQRYQLIESIPSKQYNEIIKYIDSIRDKEVELFKIDNSAVDITIDQSFFTL